MSIYPELCNSDTVLGTKNDSVNRINMITDYASLVLLGRQTLCKKNEKLEGVYKVQMEHITDQPNIL